MGEYYNTFDKFFKALPQIENLMEPFSLKNRLTVDASLLLIVLYSFPELKFGADQNLIKDLCDKGLCECEENSITVTSKGAILAKSLLTALQKI